jgi:hypothetical protein
LKNRRSIEPRQSSADEAARFAGKFWNSIGISASWVRFHAVYWVTGRL